MRDVVSSPCSFVIVTHEDASSCGIAHFKRRDESSHGSLARFRARAGSLWDVCRENEWKPNVLPLPSTAHSVYLFMALNHSELWVVPLRPLTNFPYAFASLPLIGPLWPTPIRPQWIQRSAVGADIAWPRPGDVAPRAVISWGLSRTPCRIAAARSAAASPFPITKYEHPRF